MPPLAVLKRVGNATAIVDGEQRHLMWTRPKRYGWRDITTRFVCHRSTARRGWCWRQRPPS